MVWAGEPWPPGIGRSWVRAAPCEENGGHGSSEGRRGIPNRFGNLRIYFAGNGGGRTMEPLGQPAWGPGVPTGQLLGTFACARDGSASYGVSDKGEAKTSVKNEKMLQLVLMVEGLVG